MATLWLKFADDSNLPAVLDDAAQQKLAAIFDAENPQSPWQKAVKLLGLNIMPPSEGLLRWHLNAPYINWGHVVHMVSSGWIRAVETREGGFSYRTDYNLLSLPALIKSQWRIAFYINEKTDDTAPLPESGPDQIVESIALGLALLALTLRLPAHSPETLAGWMANPDGLSFSLRKTILHMQAVQKRRTALSAAWLELFPPAYETSARNLPGHFWNEPPAGINEIGEPAPEKRTWRGLYVSGNPAQGRAHIITAKTDLSFLQNTDEPLVLIFAQARPDTTHFFEKAVAILYADGGLLSHACTIAREQNIACITGLGQGFIADLQALGKVWLMIEPENGMVELIPQ